MTLCIIILMPDIADFCYNVEIFHSGTSWTISLCFILSIKEITQSCTG